MQFLIVLGLLIVSAVITALVSKGNQSKPATLQAFSVPTVDEGTPQQVIFGDVWCDDWTVLWYGDYKVKPIRGGGKK